MFACSLGVVSMIGCYMMPESPKFLIGKKKYEEARNSINWIAKFNKQDVQFTEQFDREVITRREEIG